MRSLAFTGLGFSFAAIVGVMAWLGYEADDWLGSGPWLLISGTLLGVAVATWDLIRHVQAWERNAKDPGE